MYETAPSGWLWVEACRPTTGNECWIWRYTSTFIWRNQIPTCASRGESKSIWRNCMFTWFFIIFILYIIFLTCVKRVYIDSPSRKTDLANQWNWKIYVNWARSAWIFKILCKQMNYKSNVISYWGWVFFLFYIYIFL